MTHYLDHAASSPLLEVARQAYVEALGVTGNASSLHGAGRTARALVESAREAAADALEAHPTELLWTSGGTESNNAGVKGLYFARQAEDPGRTRILVSAVEHHAVLDPARWLAVRHGATVVEIPVDRDGVVDLEFLRDDLERHHESTALVAVMWANNEVGAIQPVREVADAAAESSVPLHVDAVQAVGHLPVSLGDLGATSVAVSAHKFGGPVGVGLWWLARGAQVDPLIHGGGQERQVRSGSVNAAGAHAAAAALRHAVSVLEAESRRLAELQVRMIDRIDTMDGAVLSGPRPGPSRLPGNVHYVFEGCGAEELLLVLDSHGVHASNGAACTAGVVQASHVLEAMGRSTRDAQSTLRFSLGHTTTMQDVDAALAVLPEAVERARQARSR